MVLALNPGTCWMPVYFCLFVCLVFLGPQLSKCDFSNLVRLSDAGLCIINVKFTYSPFCVSADVSSYRGCVGDV